MSATLPATVCRVAQLERSIGTAISIVTSNIDHAMALSGSASNLCPHFRTLPTLIVSADAPTCLVVQARGPEQDAEVLVRRPAGAADNERRAVRPQACPQVAARRRGGCQSRALLLLACYSSRPVPCIF